MNPYLHHTDTELLTLLIEGNHRAFEAIYRRYASDLYRFARKNISAKEDCEEIVHDVFESLWVRHSELNEVEALNNYLFSMVKYKVIRYLKHSKVIKKYNEHFKLFEAVYDNSAMDTRDAETIQAIIQQCLSELPERCQYAMNLRLNENLSNGDIAKRMNIEKRTVENYMARALNHLRESLPALSKAL